MVHGLLQPSLAHEGGPQAVVGLGIVGLEAKGLLQTGHGRRRLPLMQEGKSQMAVGLGMIRPELRGSLKTRRRLVQLPLELQGDSQAEVRPGVVRLDAQRLPEAVHGLLQLLLGRQLDGQVGMRLGEIGVETNRRLEVIDRQIVPARPTRDQPQEMQGAEMAGIRLARSGGKADPPAASRPASKCSQAIRNACGIDIMKSPSSGSTGSQAWIPSMQAHWAGRDPDASAPAGRPPHSLDESGTVAKPFRITGPGYTGIVGLMRKPSPGLDPMMSSSSNGRQESHRDPIRRLRYDDLASIMARKFARGPGEGSAEKIAGAIHRVAMAPASPLGPSVRDRRRARGARDLGRCCSWSSASGGRDTASAPPTGRARLFRRSTPWPRPSRPTWTRPPGATPSAERTTCSLTVTSSNLLGIGRDAGPSRRARPDGEPCSSPPRDGRRRISRRVGQHGRPRRVPVQR